MLVFLLRILRRGARTCAVGSCWAVPGKVMGLNVGATVNDARVSIRADWREHARGDCFATNAETGVLVRAFHLRMSPCKRGEGLLAYHLTGKSIHTLDDPIDILPADLVDLRQFSGRFAGTALPEKNTLDGQALREVGTFDH